MLWRAGGFGTWAGHSSWSTALLIPHRAADETIPFAVVPLAADIGDSAGTVEENRALQPEIFVGRVAAHEGEIDLGIEDPFILPIYAVDIETSLKGQAQGRVRLTVLEAESPEDLGGSPVVVGDRYLFAAEGPDQGLYWIDEGLDSLRIASDDEAAAVIAQYQQLIIDVTQNPPPPPGVHPCEFLTANPTIDIDPNEGKAGRTVRVTANRVANPVVKVYWRNLNNRVGSEDVRTDCGANLQIKVPNDARPGRYDIIIVDARGLQASERFRVID